VERWFRKTHDADPARRDPILRRPVYVWAKAWPKDERVYLAPDSELPAHVSLPFLHAFLVQILDGWRPGTRLVAGRGMATAGEPASPEPPRPFVSSPKPPKSAPRFEEPKRNPESSVDARFVLNQHEMSNKHRYRRKEVLVLRPSRRAEDEDHPSLEEQLQTRNAAGYAASPERVINNCAKLILTDGEVAYEADIKKVESMDPFRPGGKARSVIIFGEPRKILIEDVPAMPKGSNNVRYCRV
jgi:hypothetical protein